MRFALICVFFVEILCADDFINKYEYGEMLYKDPRGVSCEGCHGAKGEGRFIGKIIKNKKEITIIAPSIKNSSVDLIKKSMNTKRSVMPSYFLTDLEIDAIVFYLKRINETKLVDTNASKAE